MKLQNFAVIFLVITIPLILILSYYLTLQYKTMKIQSEYDIKLAEATKEGIKAFEINTTEWENNKDINKKEENNRECYCQGSKVECKIKRVNKIAC